MHLLLHGINHQSHCHLHGRESRVDLGRGDIASHNFAPVFQRFPRSQYPRGARAANSISSMPWSVEKLLFKNSPYWADKNQYLHQQKHQYLRQYLRHQKHHQ
jgi:hypothetical protein